LARRLTSIVALVAALMVTGLVHARIPPITRVDRGEAFVPDPEIASVLALGFEAVVADYYWLQAIQAIGGDTPMTAELGEHIGKLIDLVTTLNPRVDHPYRFAAVWLTESEENVRTANRLLLRGIEQHPDEWRNLFYLGFNYFFYLMENEKAAEALERAGELPGAPPYLKRLVARLRSETASLEVAEALLTQLLHDSEEDETRAGFQAALDEVEVERKARFLDRAREAFEKLNGRDIRSVEELVNAPHPLISVLPNPEPDALPPSLRQGSVWIIDPETNQITSTYYGARYTLHFASYERERAERWSEERKRKQEHERARDGAPNGTDGRNG